jgi:hypothetical protein
MSPVRTKPTESATKRNVFFMDLRVRRGSVTRAESPTMGPLLEYTGSSGGTTKWCNLYYGGETRAGE